ncbi:cyclic AMP-responsive element-binding protein 3-like protein 4 isoform X2 [Stegostoma tigrinum]|nr:cyclic AMP-responsive element-binding protein 3-like protein 4 isoform X2 [Stegostoma tigrinum]XP_059499040.1 cyclic AMP-responsive element-binding protein 3-like protein 4 isoform X2 [Stegostoma tigrinum]
MNAANEEPLGVYYREYTVFLESGYSASNSSYPGQDDDGTALEKLLEEWAVPTTNSLNESESDEVFQTMINPNEVLSSVNTIKGASETDSGISDDHRPESPRLSESGPDAGAGPSALCQLVYGVSNIKSQRAANNTDLVSIELGGWNTATIVPEACIVDSAPGLTSSVKRTLSVTDSDSEISDCFIGHFPDLMLTEEEKRLLSQEGIVLPSNLPLTKAEERVLKKVRRKIRNKQSAQESRRRKKEYIDGLESRVAACTAQNHELQKQVLKLEHHNISLLTQLRRLQSVIKETSNKAAQTSTCVLILTFSLVLLVFPSYNLIQSETPVNKHGYKPTGVISRTILTELESSQISEIPDNSLPDASGSVNLQEGAVPFPNNLTTDSQEPGNPLGPVGQMPKRVSHLEASQLQKSDGNSLFGRREDTSDSGAAIPSSELLQQEPRTDMPPASSWESGNALLVKPGHADEM